MEKQTMWAVFGPDGKIIIGTLSKREEEAKDRAVFKGHVEWPECNKRGYSCQKVSVTITKI